MNLTRRTKRGLSRDEIDRMHDASVVFQGEIRNWIAQIPLQSQTYVGLC